MITTEGPINIYEYIACGVPVVSDNYPGLSAVVEMKQMRVCVDAVIATDISTDLKEIVAIN